MSSLLKRLSLSRPSTPTPDTSSSISDTESLSSFPSTSSSLSTISSTSSTDSKTKTPAGNRQYKSSIPTSETRSNQAKILLEYINNDIDETRAQAERESKAAKKGKGKGKGKKKEKEKKRRVPYGPRHYALAERELEREGRMI